MKNKLKVFSIVCLLLLAGITELTAQGFSISGRRLIDGNGSEFIIRGISHAHCWYTDRTSAIADIASVGANAIRLVCSNGTRWTQTSSSELSNLINLCRSNQLIAIPEVHDTTGYGEEGAACSLSQAVSYWRNMQSVLNGEERYVLINIGNEPYGNNNYENWIGDTQNAIQSMRSAGFSHTLVVDAPNWGQDWSFTMRDNAQAIFDADPDRNTLLSVHMYGVYDTAAEVQDYISTVTGQGLPLMIGEFGHNHSDGDPDEDAIMSNAQSYGIGYIGWSWCGNSGGVEYLDMVNNWDPNSLTSWGDRIINGSNGIRSTSQICSVYSGQQITPDPNETPTPTPPPTETPTPGPTDASLDCSGVPEWTAEDIYDTAGMRVQYNGKLYENNWYSQNQNPEENSGEYEVWTLLGPCDSSSTPTPISDTPSPTPTPTPVTDTPQPGAGNVWIEPANQEVGMSSPFTIEIHGDTGNQNLAAYGFDVIYDSNLISVDTAVGDDGVEEGPDGFVAAVNAQNAGTIVISGFDTSGTGPGSNLHIVTINFIAGNNPGTSSIGLVINDFADPDTQPIGNPNGTGGSVTITDVTLGDVNSDGTIDVIDALLTAQYYVGLNPSPFNTAAADTNCDGSIDIVDALLIAQYYVGLISQFC